MELSPLKLLIVAIVILVLFGRGRISEMMGDFGKGIKEFKKGMNEEGNASAPPPQLPAATPVPPATAEHPVVEQPAPAPTKQDA
jgi:sec-independent protein translocase protein TatA